MAPVSTFENLVGKGLSLVEFSAPFANCSSSPCTFYDFPTVQMEGIRQYGAIPLLSWSSASSQYDPLLVSDPDFQLGDVIAGTYDSYIRSFATAAKAWGHPFFLRFNWEMNGNWFPWSEGVNGNRAGEYVAAWRHVHDIFTLVGATNATWVWCPYADIRNRLENLRVIYPGAAYTDWTCVDGFNWGNSPVNPQPPRSFDQIFARTYRRVTTKIAPKKPLLLAEMASSGGTRAKAAWIRDMFQQLRTKYRRVRGLTWFDKVDRGVDWPLETSPAATRAFARGIGTPAFRGNSYTTLTGAPIGPPR